MSVREYIGARYVPLFADPIEWDNTKTYEPLTIVYYQGNSYTSRQAVPTGIAITNETYWALTGNYNAQIEAYRQEVQNLSEEVLAFDDKFDANGKINTDLVVENSIADDSVTTDKIENLAVTEAKLANASVTTNKIADNAVTEDKLADNVVSLIQEKTNPGIISMAQPVAARSCDIARGIQGGAVFEHSGEKYFIVYDGYPNVDTSEIVIINKNNQVTASLGYDCQHGNCICVRGNKAYIASGDTNKVYVFTISPASITYSETLTFSQLSDTWGFAIDNDGNYIVCNSAYAFIYDPSNLTTPTRTIQLSNKVPSPNYAVVTSYNGCCFDPVNNMLITLFCGAATSIYYFDYTTGNFVKNIVFADHFAYINVKEIEWIDVKGNDIYFCVNPSLAQLALSKQVYTILHTNLVNPFGITSELPAKAWSPAPFTITYDESSNVLFPNIYGDVTVNNATYLMGYAQWIAKSSTNGANILFNSDCTENLSFTGNNMQLNIGNHRLKYLYLAFCYVTLDIANNSVLFTDSYWSKSSLFAVRFSTFIQTAGNPPSSYAPTKQYINAIASSYYIASDALASLSTNSFTVCNNWRA